jgi:hypothetical protein
MNRTIKTLLYTALTHYNILNTKLPTTLSSLNERFITAKRIEEPFGQQNLRLDTPINGYRKIQTYTPWRQIPTSNYFSICAANLLFRFNFTVERIYANEDAIKTPTELGSVSIFTTWISILSVHPHAHFIKCDGCPSRWQCSCTRVKLVAYTWTLPHKRTNISGIFSCESIYGPLPTSHPQILRSLNDSKDATIWCWSRTSETRSCDHEFTALDYKTQ